MIKITIHFVLHPVNWRWMALSYFLAIFFYKNVTPIQQLPWKNSHNKMTVKFCYQSFMLLFLSLPFNWVLITELHANYLWRSALWKTKLLQGFCIQNWYSHSGLSSVPWRSNWEISHILACTSKHIKRRAAQHAELSGVTPAVPGVFDTFLWSVIPWYQKLDNGFEMLIPKIIL